MKSESTTTVAIDTAGDSYFNGGNVGIGVTPAARLHAYSASAETLRLEGNDEFTYLSFKGTVWRGWQKKGTSNVLD